MLHALCHKGGRSSGYHQGCQQPGRFTACCKPSVGTGRESKDGMEGVGAN